MMQFGVCQNEKFDHSNILFTFCCNDDNATAYSCSIDICYKKIIQETITIQSKKATKT